jgi:hypothetical protein
MGELALGERRRRSEVDSLHPAANRVISSGKGRPMDQPVLASMGSLFGFDFSKVRIHDGLEATESARAVDAIAYTVGQDIVFPAGRYSPSTPQGRKLLAHELAHVIQQNRQTSPSSPDVLEQSAEQASASASRGESIHVAGTGRVEIARQPANLLQDQDPAALSNENLAKEIVMVRKWLVEHPVSSAENNQMSERLSALEGEASKRVQRDNIMEKAKKTSGSSASVASSPSVDSSSITPVVGAAIAIPFPAVTGGATSTAATAAGETALGGVLAPIAAFLAVFLYPSTTITSAEEERMLEKSREQTRTRTQVATVPDEPSQMAQQTGKVVRGLTAQIVVHLARILGKTVNGQPPDHQGDPKKDRPHWWKEIVNWIKQILEKGLTNKQLIRELAENYSPEQLAEIREALRDAAKLLGEDPPNFPPAASP